MDHRKIVYTTLAGVIGLGLIFAAIFGGITYFTLAKTPELDPTFTTTDAAWSGCFIGVFLGLCGGLGTLFRQLKERFIESKGNETSLDL